MLILCSTINLVSILSRSLPTAPGYWTEEGFEAVHKLERFRRLHHARKHDIGLNKADVVKMQFCAANPSILCHIKKHLVPKRKKRSSQLPEDQSIDDLLVTPPAPKEAEVEKPESAQVESNDSDEEFNFGTVDVPELKALESDLESDQCDSDESDQSDIEFVVEEDEEEDEEEL